MSHDQQAIAEYTRRFQDHLVGPAQQKAAARAELVEHLTDAADAGELAQWPRSSSHNGPTVG
jgi:hypothetical protein